MKVKFIVNTLLGLTLANAKLIMLIRHGEKISDDYTDLSPEGKARADCLVNTFGSNGIYTTPQKIYAQRPTEQRKSTRPVDTVTPLAQSLGLEIDTTYTSGKFKDLAKYIATSPEEVILVSWANDRIPEIAKQLGIKKAPEWKGKVFDDVWVITDGKTPYIKDASSNIVPKQSFMGKKSLNMEIVEENVTQCMAEQVVKYSTNPANTANTNTANTGNSLGDTDSTNDVDSGSEIIKISTMTLTTLLCMIYFLFN